MSRRRNSGVNFSRNKSGSDLIAEALRADAPSMDDIRKAKLERSLLEELRKPADADGQSSMGQREGAQPSPGERRSGSFAPIRTIAWAAVAIAAAALLFVFAFGDGADAPSAVTEPGPAAGQASMRRYRSGEQVTRGAIASGEHVVTGDHERVEVGLADARIDVGPGSNANFASVLGDDLRVHLNDGTIEVEFHPARRGEQQMHIVTPAARVEVVGTVFQVTVSPNGDSGSGPSTTVRVTEGVVRVIPSSNEPVRLVHAGEETRVEGAEGLGAPTASEPQSAEADAPLALAVQAPTPDPSTASRLVVSSPATRASRAESEGEEGPEADAESEARTALEPEPGAQEIVESEAETAGEAEAAADPTAAGALTAPRQARVTSSYDTAEELLASGQHEQARRLLYRVVRESVTVHQRVRGWTLIAEAWTAQGDRLQAAEAYRRAASAAPRSRGGLIALFALGRLRQRMGENEAALAAYRQYLRLAPDGPHAELVRESLCRSVFRPLNSSDAQLRCP